MTTLNAIRTLTIRSKAEGVQETTAALKGLQAAHDGVAKSAQTTATVTDMASKRQLSVAAAYQRQTQALDEAARMQDKLSRATRVADTAFQQGLITHTEHAKRLDLINQKLGQLSTQQKATSVILQDFQSRMAMATGSTGVLGAALAALGPVGLGVAATIGAGVLALNAMSNAAHGLAEKAQELRRFSEVTGLTTAQVQALRSEAGKFGVTSDEAQTAIQNFTARFDDLRRGQGELLTQIRRVNPALADQMQMTTNAGDALTLFAQGLAKVDDVFQRNALVKAATGRGGIGAAQFLASLNVDQLTQSYIAAGKGLDDGLIKKLAQLEIDIQKTSKAASQAIASIFSEETLQLELRYQKGWLDFANSVKSFAISGDLRYLLETILKVQIGGPGTLLGKLGIDYSAGYKAPSRGDTFADRFQPAMDNPLKAFTPAAANSNKTLEAQVEDLKRLTSVLGPAATESEKLALKQKELQLAARDAGVSTDILSRAQNALNAEFKLNQLREVVSVLGAAATMSQQYALKQAELAQKVAQGAISQEVATRALKDFANDQSLTFLRNNVTALGAAATASQQYTLRVAELQQQVDRGQISQETFNRAVFEANPLVHEVKSSFEQLASSIVQAMMAGKGFTESLAAGLKNLSMRLADEAIKSLLSGDFTKAAIAGISAAVTFIGSEVFGNKDKQVKAINEVNDRIHQYMSARAAAVQAMNPDDLAARLGQFEHEANLQRIQEERAGNGARAALEETLSVQRAQIIDEFGKRAIAAEKEAADARLAILQRQQSLQDRLLAATVDQTTLGGQLEVFNRQAQREREAEAQAGGQAMVDLEAAQAAERFNLIKSFNDKIVDDAKRTAQEQLDAQTRAARAIVDYVNGLQTGPDSALSPTQRLSAAQATYNSILPLAQAGNIDALGRITQDFENLRKAAQSFYGSSSGYQNILNAGINQLLALPSVATSTDPVVSAVRDVTAAVQVNTTATGATTNAVQLDTTQTVNKFNEAIQKFADAVTYMSQAVNQLTTSNSLLDAIKALNRTSSDTLALLNQQYSVAAAVGTGAGHQGTSAPPSNDLSNNMLTALNKIVYNTWSTASNTAFALNNTVVRQFGTYATGGTVPPGGFGIFGEHHPDGPFFMRAGNNPVPITPSMPSASNDNGSLERKIDRLTEVLAAVGAAMVNTGMMTAEQTRAVGTAVSQLTDAVKSEARQDRNNPRRQREAA